MFLLNWALGSPAQGVLGGVGLLLLLGRELQPPYSMTQSILTLVPEEGVPCSRLERVRAILVRNREGVSNKSHLWPQFSWLLKKKHEARKAKKNHALLCFTSFSLLFSLFPSLSLSSFLPAFLS